MQNYILKLERELHYTILLHICTPLHSQKRFIQLRNIIKLCDAIKHLVL